MNISTYILVTIFMLLCQEIAPSSTAVVACNTTVNICPQPASEPPAGCDTPNIYVTPDDCGCQHWHCKQLPSSVEQTVCPQGWTSYHNREGSTYCIKVLPTEVTWLRARLICNMEDNSDLFNARQFESFAEGNATLYNSVLDDLERDTNDLPHWSGLHMINDKLYWDSTIPFPDRDLTSESQSIVQFYSAQWTALLSGRSCVSYKSDNGPQGRVTFQPEYCSAGFPFICSKLIPANVQSFYKPNNGLLCGGEEGWAGSVDSATCYKYFTDLVPFAEAQRVCQQNQGVLADPRTEFKQRYLVGTLHGLPNGVAPLTVHVGVQQLDSSQVRFGVDEIMSVSQLEAQAIFSTPTAARQCGVLNNPFFAEQRLDSGLVQFGECAAIRPFICTRDFSSKSVDDASLWNVTVVRDEYTLSCLVIGLDGVPGVIVWKKDHQYFPKQNNSINLSLTSAEYKYMIDDRSNRTIGHGELAGVYACEFRQTYPLERYTSADLAVTFNDSTSLRMSTILNDTTWSVELEAFNHRVSHMDELSPQVQVVYDRLLVLVQNTLRPFSESSVQYSIHIISLRQAPNNKVDVDYRIILTGDVIANSQTANVTSSADAVVLDNILDTLSNSELSNDESQNTSIEGQFTCLQRTLVHPQTLVNLTLPRKPDGIQVTVSGDCRGQTTTMLTATCQYNKPLRLSTWTNISYTNCSISCLSQTVSHSVSGQSFTLFNAAEGQTHKFTGVCGQHEQEMLSAACITGSWHVTELECVLMCPPGQFNHPQWPTPLPGQEVPVNSTYNVDMLCDASNKTILTARCEINSEGSGGVWTDVVMDTCEVTCKSERIVHPAGTSWNMSESALGHAVELTGRCNGLPVNLGSATCEGDVTNGAFWNVTLSICHVSCPSQIFIHPDTNKPISLGAGELNETTIQNLSCDGEVLPVEIECVGTLSLGATWRLKSLPGCSPECQQTEWYDPVTDRTYTIESADFMDQSVVKGLCGGVETTLMVANCAGDIADNVSWEFDIFNCTPSCDAIVVSHPDTSVNFSLPIASHNKSVTLSGSCNGDHHVALVTAQCGGDVTSVPQWTDVDFLDCVGYCEPETVYFSDKERPPSTLPIGRVGERTSVNGTCAMLSYIEITAECIGSAVDGGQWNYTIHSCDIDTSCPSQHFAHPETKDKLVVDSTPVDNTVAVEGQCHGDVLIMMNVTCLAVAGARGIWVNDTFALCETDVSDQLNNLFENFKDDPLELTSLTASISEDLDNSTDEIISQVVDIVEFVANPATEKSVENEGEFFFDIINNMMGADLGTDSTPETADGKNSTLSSGNRLAKSVETFLSSAKLNTSRISLKRDKLFVEVIDGGSLGAESEAAVVNNELSVSLPRKVVNGSTLSFVKYDSPAMFSTSKSVLGDTVFSASISDRPVAQIDGAITFAMQIPVNGTLPETAVCSYWNFSISDWSSEGCEMKKGNMSVTCTCNHLTNFAILLDIEGQQNYISEEHHLALSIITTIGLGISIAALSLHLISFMCIEKLRRNQFQKVLANLAFAILASNLVFLAGIDKVANEIACIAVAALLHYFILASFCWMFVEAFMQYRRFVKVLGTHVEYILVKAGLPAWILPAIPVAIVFIIDPQLYRGGERFCWMSREALYYSFLAPVAAVIIANVVLFILILRGLTCARPAKLRSNKSESTLRMMYFKAGLAVFTLLGMTWVFGFFAINDVRLVFQYLFCITNAFQGLVIFILHNIRDPKVVAWWRSILRMEPLRPHKFTGASTSTYLSKKAEYSRSTSVDDWEADRRRAIKQRPKVTDEPATNEPEKIHTNDELKDSAKESPNKHLQLEQSKLMHSSTESDESNASQGSAASSGVESSATVSSQC